MNIIGEIEAREVAKQAAVKDIPEFGPGDTIRVNVKVVEGSRERIQVFEGVCIARKNAGINSAFTVRKISYGEGVERIFPLYSPRVDSIEVVRRGRVRRAKLYYLRGLRGKAARITEKSRYHDDAKGGKAAKPKAKPKPKPKTKSAAKGKAASKAGAGKKKKKTKK